VIPFSQQRLLSSCPLLRVKDLPTPAPSAFAGTVGELESPRVSTSHISVGDSVTWTLELRRTGNWPETTRVVSKDFQGVAPIMKRKFKPGSLFEGSLTEDVLIVPTKACTSQLGSVRFVYFDSNDGKYQIVTTETSTLSGRVERRPRPQTKARRRTAARSSPPPSRSCSKCCRKLVRLPPALAQNGVPIARGAIVAFWLRIAIVRGELTDPLQSRRPDKPNLSAILQSLQHAGLPAAETRHLVYHGKRMSADLGGITTTPPAAVKIARASKAKKFAPVAEQQNHLQEPVAHSLAGFWPAIRRSAGSLRSASRAPGIENPVFSGFIDGGMKYKIARTFSPGESSLGGRVAAVLPAITAALLLSGFY